MMFPEYEVVASWPEFTDLMQNGIGFYLHDPQDSENADKTKKLYLVILFINIMNNSLGVYD